MEKIRNKVEKILNENITECILKATGACNDAYYLRTCKGKKYIVKQERTVQEFTPQNTLIVEATVIKHLYKLHLSIPVPRISFISENPDMYGYEFIHGNTLIDVWSLLSEENKIKIFYDLGHFHAEIGKQISKEKAKELGVKIDNSLNLHPEVLSEYDEILSNEKTPETLKVLARKAKKIFDTTMISNKTVFQFIHNDAHHENIIIKNKKVSGFIDFGNAEYGEIAKEFSRYIRDYPHYFRYIVLSYEENSGNKLSYDRLITNALLSGLIDIVEDYHEGGEKRYNAENKIQIYRELIDAI